jgi:hypothetical protein
VQIGGILADAPSGDRRDVHVARVLGIRGECRLGELLAFSPSTVRPVAGDHVVRLAAGSRRQVHGHHAELGGGTALQEQHYVVIGDAHEGPQGGFSGGGDRLEHGRAMPHLHHRLAGAAVVEEFLAQLQHHFRGQHRRAGAEIIATPFHPGLDLLNRHLPRPLRRLRSGLCPRASRPRRDG